MSMKLKTKSAMVMMSALLALGFACSKTENNVTATGGTGTEETSTTISDTSISSTMITTAVDTTMTSAATNSAMTSTSSASTSSMSPANLSDGDRKFVEKAATGGMAEVQMAGVAIQKASAADVKAFAQRLNDDHSKANAEFTQLVSSKGITAPTDLNNEQKEMMAKMSSMSGPGFDKDYVKGMVQDHKEDIALFEKEAKDGKDADLQAFAARTLPTLKEHQKMAQDLNAKLK